MNSTNESSLIGAPSSAARSNSAEVIYREFAPPRARPRPGTSALVELVESYERDPDKAARLTAARKTISAGLYGDSPETLVTLRLSAGLSQTQLAAKTGTTQSHLSNIELGKQDPGTDFVARLAIALGTSEARVFEAIRRLRNEASK